MFTLIGKQAVKSDRGFTVQFTGRFEFKYSEDFGEIDIPFDSDLHAIYVDDKDFYRWNDGRKISEQKKCEILKNVIEGMTFLKVIVVVE